ncbi:ParB family protein of integrating conjugative element (PFGI_1 class) [Yokenella regensburgei]|uniref:ParB family protein of integrating conjugative element (PFGI_1 class) n=1 Tax=Yokenella regensburgei TaxID=158877 RepID=A0ABX9RVX1_9ENTR|nr:ParB family protein [Yokenella regensburgei]RKR53688.1 ParB family protein of integrating conjugative element (PFGI_1 class) [Yokenella regensburgei]VFS15069.1 integrating conjugative element, PFGI_1 class, ParB family protein [Yokenella regensburgei]
MTSKKSSQLGEKLLQRGRTPNPESTAVVLPVNEMPMVLALEQLRPNPDNPRTSRNPKYEDIKASIRARGLDSVPKVTRDPESLEDVYIFSDGGNTRYSILTELYAETGDERFRRVQCIVKPWPGRFGHLAENDVRGELSFIEKAFGIDKARAIYEEQLGREVSQRELADLLKEAGYPVHHSNISRMVATIEHLWPWIPNLLNSGMGRPQIAQLITLRTAAEKAWQAFSQNVALPPEQDFNDVFGGVCCAFDDPEHYSADVFKEELIAALLKAMPDPQLTYDSWLIELDPQEQNRRKLFGAPEPLPQHVLDADKTHDEPSQPPVTEPPSVTTDSRATGKKPVATGADSFEHIDQPPDEEQLDLYDGNIPPNSTPELPDVPPEADQEPAECVDGHLQEASANAIAFAANGLEPVTDIWHIPALQDDVEHLQDIAFRLAFELAEVMGIEDIIQEDKSLLGAGYSLPSNADSELLAALCGGGSYTPLSTLTGLLLGAASPFGEPLLNDAHAVKFLRLIRVVRRLRELQRQTFGEGAA